MPGPEGQGKGSPGVGRQTQACVGTGLRVKCALNLLPLPICGSHLPPLKVQSQPAGSLIPTSSTHAPSPGLAPLSCCLEHQLPPGVPTLSIQLASHPEPHSWLFLLQRT